MPKVPTVHRTFGYVIAYVLPGFVSLWAITLVWPQLPLGVIIGSVQQPTFSQGVHVLLGRWESGSS